MTYLATCAFGIEGILKNELLLLGLNIEEVQPGNVIFTGDDQAFVRANLCLRTADRIYLVLHKFKAMSFDALFDTLSLYPFADFVPSNAQVTVDAKSHQSALFSLRDIQSISKKAIVTSLGRAYQITHLPEDGVLYHFLIRIEKDVVQLLLDTSGEPLHRRGYRISGKLAPIRENMAASLVLLSRFYGKGPFIDPMCGSGTIVIEAAMIAKDIAPGLFRTFQFEAWGTSTVEQERERLRAKIKPRLDTPIEGYDKDASAIRLAVKNAKAAGVYRDIHLAPRDLKDFSTSLTGGTVVTNAPYGERMGDSEEIKEIEQLITDKLLSLETFRLGLLLGSDQFAKGKKRRTSKVRKLYNGRIQTFFYQYEPTKRW